ncbi:low-density lipoprotein receptor-related protein 6-like [Uloborus diversus]|uniref:low-density lipoprotein receptor-related protein 6-like n=1 Tax=Uloborus diversus TaxID=327109 RepID=UPI00240A54B2|nr:low-density lipoprotein receptor-related protein 6-like [Uloborus diversus]
MTHPYSIRVYHRQRQPNVAKQGQQFLLYGRGQPGAIKGIPLETSNKQEDVMFPILGLNTPEVIDYDARSQFIYYSDVERYAIESMMYWSDRSTEFFLVTKEYGGKIERAHMDGSNREVFLNVNLQWPNGLSIDYVDKKLYWCDAYLHRIERISLDGTNRETLLSGESLNHPYGLAHYDNYVFWSEYYQGLVLRLHLPNKTITTLAKENPPVYQIRIFDASMQTGMWFYVD